MKTIHQTINTHSESISSIITHKIESNIDQISLTPEFPTHIFINKKPQKYIYFSIHSSTVIDDCNHSSVLVWTALSPFRKRLNLRVTLNTLRLLKRNWAQEGLTMCVYVRVYAIINFVKSPTSSVV